MKIRSVFTLEDILGYSDDYEILSNFEQVIIGKLYSKVGRIHTINDIEFVEKTETGFVVDVTFTTVLVHEKTTFYWSLEDFVYEIGFIAGGEMKDRVEKLIRQRIAKENPNYTEFPVVIEKTSHAEVHKGHVGYAVEYMILNTK